MKQISCEFADQALAEQAVHSLRQHGYAIKEESLEAKEYQAKTPPVAMAGQLMTFPSQPVPDGFVILHSENKAEPHALGCTLRLSCPDDQASRIHSRLPVSYTHLSHGYTPVLELQSPPSKKYKHKLYHLVHKRLPCCGQTPHPVGQTPVLPAGQPPGNRSPQCRICQIKVWR